MPRVKSVREAVDISIPKGGDDAARGYYGRILGLRETMKPPGERGVWFQVEDKAVRLVPSEGFAPRSDAPLAMFTVDSAEGLRMAINRARFRHYDAPPVPGMRGFYALDPFGNRLEFREVVSTRLAR